MSLSSTNLDHGDGYGKGHFTTQSLGGLADAIIAPTGRGWMPSKQRDRVRSFVSIPRRLREVERARRELKHLEAAKTVFSQLAMNPQLCGLREHKLIPDSAADGAIQIWDALMPNADGKYPVLYFYLRAASDRIVASITAKLVLNLLKDALLQFTDFCREGWIAGKPVEVDVIIDEASYVLDRSVKSMIDQGAGFGLRLVIATQDMTQLEAEDPKFAKTVFENCGNKLIFTSRSSTWQDELMKLSGEKALHHLGYTISGNSLGRGQSGPEHSVDGFYSVRREPSPRFERNHLIEMSDTANRAMFIPAQSAGTTCYDGYPIMVDVPFLHTKEKFEYLKTLLWPARTDEMIVPAEFLDAWDDFVTAESGL